MYRYILYIGYRIFKVLNIISLDMRIDKSYIMMNRLIYTSNIFYFKWTPKSQRNTKLN